MLQCLRDFACRSGGEAGSSIKLAHTFLSVAVRYYGRKVLPKRSKPTGAARILQTQVGEREILRSRDKAKLAIHAGLRKITKPFAPEPRDGASRLIGEPFASAAQKRIGDFPGLTYAL
jgi:hypothetical protein